MNSTVTVIMAAYNAASYLSESIESVLAQTFTDWELLIIDDGSCDNTAEVASHYSKKDSRIKLLSQSNQGVSLTRNRGINLSNAEFIAFIDADDKWFPDKIANHIQHLQENTNVGVSFGRVEFLSPDGKHTGQLSNSRITQMEDHHFLYENPTITVSNLVVRRQVFQEIGCFDGSMSYSEDLDFLLRVICNSRWKIEGINQVLMGYRTAESGLSSNLYRMEEGWETLIAKSRKYAPDLVNKHYFKAQSTHLRYLARRAFRLRLPAKVGVDFMNRALRADWQIILREPRRTLLTMLAVYGSIILNLFEVNSSLNQGLQK